MPTDYSYLKGCSHLKLYCKKQSNQKPTVNIVSSTRRTTLRWGYTVILKNFSSSNLSCICPFLLETNLNNKTKYSVYEKLSRVFSVAGSSFGREIRPPTPVLLTIHFSAAMKTLVFGNLFKFFRLAITFARDVYHLGIKMKTNMTIGLFFSLSPTPN